jgi:hypothetical protein
MARHVPGFFFALQYGDGIVSGVQEYSHAVHPLHFSLSMFISLTNHTLSNRLQRLNLFADRCGCYAPPP